MGLLKMLLLIDNDVHKSTFRGQRITELCQKLIFFFLFSLATRRDAGEGVLVCPRLKDALTLLEENYQNKIENVWIIGGARVYEVSTGLE